MNLYITSEKCILHDNGVYHPEMGERLKRIQDYLISSQLYDWFLHADSRAASNDEITLFHHPELIKFLEKNSPEQGVVEVAEDIHLCEDSVNAARHAVGAVLDAVDAVQLGRAQRAFCNVRPPGHHAEYNEAKGFCLFNNVAVGAAYAIQKYGLQRVAIIDFDVHHGNGTEDFVRREPRAFLASSFEYPLYPFSEPESDINNMVKMPLKKYAKSEEFKQAWSQIGLPAIDAFAPELIIISAGFDAHALDPLGNLQLHEKDFVWITQELIKLANKHCQGKMISVLEGGYDLGALRVSATDHIKTFFELNF
ncbi:histone deacetylase family protein [Thiomicrorhabdus sp.]|uniref:histone deacetylase family protein n=1 Tax=Thiomicrorhabdus sp. TaxID=2039724 RepID=UPI002AA7C1B3|nr:histone deacetylase family protein [Thiomicrorhabdus sp.]